MEYIGCSRTGLRLISTHTKAFIRRRRHELFLRTIISLGVLGAEDHVLEVDGGVGAVVFRVALLCTLQIRRLAVTHHAECHKQLSNIQLYYQLTEDEQMYTPTRTKKCLHDFKYLFPVWLLWYSDRAEGCLSNLNY